MPGEASEIKRGARKRAKTARRAEQNRAAQRRYREKLKARQTQLEEFARRRGYDPDVSTEPRGAVPNWSDVLASDSPPEVSGVGPNEPHCSLLVGQDDSFDETGSPEEIDMVNVYGKPQYPDFMVRSPAELVNYLEDDCVSHEMVLDKDKILAEYDLRAFASTSQLLSSDKRLLLEHLFHVLGLDDRDSNIDLVRLAFSQGLNLRQLLYQGIRSLMKNEYGVERPFPYFCTGLADPYANNLRFKRFATLDAMMSNALALGYHLPDLYNLKKPSKLWRPEVRSVADLQGDLAASYVRMPPHLRPVSLQIKRTHKPYIDLLPFPALRIGIIAAVTHDPPTIDEFDLKHDIMHDGITCSSNGRPSDGQPWDMGSWEIAPWFKEKWSPMLLPREITL